MAEVVFADDFESGNLDRWDDDSVMDDPQRLRLSEEAAYRGRYGVEITALPGSGAGAKLNKWFYPGYDQVHVRWYCRFAEDFDQGNHMHFSHLLANRADHRYWAFGQAGKKPAGDDFFTTGLEPWRDWGQHSAPGEMMRSETSFVPERGRRYCMEMMLKANTPGEADGGQAFWVEGVLLGRFEGIHRGDTLALKINDFWLMLFVHVSERVNRVYFDEVVISREYIGPLAAETTVDD